MPSDCCFERLAALRDRVEETPDAKLLPRYRAQDAFIVLGIHAHTYNDGTTTVRAADLATFIDKIGGPNVLR